MSASVPRHARAGSATLLPRRRTSGTALAPVEDIDGDLEATSPLSIIAPRRLGQTGIDALPIALRIPDVVARSPQRVVELLARHRGLGGRIVDTFDGTRAARAVQSVLGRWSGGADSIVTARTSASVRPGPQGTRDLVEAVDAMLVRLGRECLDILYLDGQDHATALTESLAAAERLMDAGKVRCVGAVHAGVGQLMEARVLSATGLPRLVAVQCEYGLFHRPAFEGAMAALCSGQDLAVCPTPTPGDPAFASAGRAGTDVARPPRRFFGRRARITAALARVGLEQHAAAASVAFAWLLSRRGIAAPVVSPTLPHQVDEAMAACALRLTRAQMRELDAASA